MVSVLSFHLWPTNKCPPRFDNKDLNLKHDVLNLFSDLFSDNNQNLSFFSEFIFNSHYMFRRSGPGHMLLHTVQKQKVQGRISLSLSLSLVKVKVKFTQTEVYKDSPLEKN